MAPAAASDPLPVSETETASVDCTLGQIPVGGRIVLRCRKDWRTACVVRTDGNTIVLSVVAPSGHRYRVKRPAETAMSIEGGIPVLGKGDWRQAMVRYDFRW